MYLETTWLPYTQDTPFKYGQIEVLKKLRMTQDNSGLFEIFRKTQDNFKYFFLIALKFFIDIE